MIFFKLHIFILMVDVNGQRSLVEKCSLLTVNACQGVKVHFSSFLSVQQIVHTQSSQCFKIVFSCSWVWSDEQWELYLSGSEFYKYPNFILCLHNLQMQQKYLQNKAGF